MILLGLIWVILVLGPILPVQPYSPHHLYLPAAGSTLLLTALALGTWRAIKRHWSGLARSEPYASTLVAGLLVLATVMACLVSGWLYIFGTASEDQLASDVLQRTDSLQSGDELFFINQPLVAGWPGPAVETAAGGRLHDLKSYTLTLADELILMTQPSCVTAVDRYHLQLQADSPAGWAVPPARPLRNSPARNGLSSLDRSSKARSSMWRSSRWTPVAAASPAWESRFMSPSISRGGTSTRLAVPGGIPPGLAPGSHRRGDRTVVHSASKARWISRQTLAIVLPGLANPARIAG